MDLFPLGFLDENQCKITMNKDVTLETPKVASYLSNIGACFLYIDRTDLDKVIEDLPDP